MLRKLRTSARRINKNHRATLVHVVALPKLTPQATTVWYAPAGFHRGVAQRGATPEAVAANRQRLRQAVDWCTVEFGPPAFKLVGTRYAADPRWTQEENEGGGTVAFKFRDPVDATAFRLMFG